MSVWRSGIIFFALMDSAAISASAADAIDILIICSIVKTGPLSFVLGSFSERNICAPALLLALDSLRNTVSEQAANIISIFLKRMPSLGWKAT